MFVVLIVLTGVMTMTRFPFSKIKTMVLDHGGGLRGALLTAINASSLASELSDQIVLHDRWIDLYGGMQRACGVYLNGDAGFVSIRNLLRDDGLHIVMFKDSFADCMAPYLALCCAQIDLIDLRYYEGSSLDYIVRTKPDAVCVSMFVGSGNEAFRYQ